MDPKIIAVSEKIYRALLHFYPQSHRRDYGEQMAQLFRDQCRDAWQAERFAGLVKLWLRVLPDMGKTSVMEQIAAIERNSSNLRSLDGSSQHKHINIQTKQNMKKQIHILILTGWLIPVSIALVFFGRWIREIVVPTLKGGNFDQLYDLHRVRYLDTTLVCIAIAFIWAGIVVLRLAWKHNESKEKRNVDVR